ncbi:AI-2E family transporter [Roseibium marinum]|uniref:Putative PurR-regulated permease PerM n=1 Tax=Roseibium marinum TaxID=281252 RepID=A0A2S3ULS7_9HYPH|nr:AI-2E family transporter [Roseibium marinum]POF28429.1 putative PurR-regulated permease PerM [Roseibium marinum]
MTSQVKINDGAQAGAGRTPAPALRADPAVRISLLILCGLALTAALDFGQVILAPICLSLVVGTLFGPAADRLSRIGVPSWMSALAMVLLFVALILSTGAAFVVPLSDWMDKLPLIWAQLQSQLTSWQGFFASVASLQNELQNAMGQSGNMQVSVDDTSAVESVFYFAPTFVAQVILFLASLYFFILTRPHFRESLLRMCDDHHQRRNVATVIQAIETRLSTYLVYITFINVGLGAAVALAMWALGVPSPLLWGMLAGLLNYIVYIGPAAMVAVLTGVGLATGNTLLAILTPPAAYLVLNLMEAQFVTPMVLGRTMTLNPFVVFLTIAFWIWLWGPAGGFVAVPLLLVAYSIFETLDQQSSNRARLEI